MREEIEKAMDEAIKPYLEYIAKGLRTHGFPVDEGGNLVNWSSWIARRQIDAVMSIVEPQR